MSVAARGDSWRTAAASSFSRTFHVGRRTRVPLRADEVGGSGGSIGSFSSTARERKRERNSDSVACKGFPVSCVWCKVLSKTVNVPQAVANPPWGHRGRTLC